MVGHSSLSCRTLGNSARHSVKLLDWRASAILAQLSQPQSLRQVTPPPQVGPETAYQFLNLLWATGFLSVEAETPDLKLWEFHNLLFHSRCRQGRHDYPTADIAGSVDVWEQFPVAKPPMSGQIIPLPQLNIDAIRQKDKTLTTAIEKRESIREYDDNLPITIEQLGELLYRTARIKEIYTFDAEQQEMLKAQFGEDFDWGEISRRPYPCGGAMYELEVYPVVRRCQGMNSGLYHYDPLNHQLAQIETEEAHIQALIKDAYQSSGEQGMPQVLLIITARFGRLFRKYRSLAYALVLKHVGVLYQNLYLVATNMGLAPCALGAGDSDTFAQATGLDYIVESSVGEFMLGSLPNQDIDNNDDLDKDEKAEAHKAAFPDSLLKRIHGDNHACHITSTIVGQENTPSPGLAPNCRVINVPLNTTGTDEEFISPIILFHLLQIPNLDIFHLKVRITLRYGCLY
ncbi:MAG: SagB family peptide dehydrogenase [Crocosphaera sp.]|nr:SagB family peptide dehydrogenase [Crocosphaera sp.]